jgi:hypothetical protein
MDDHHFSNIIKLGKKNLVGRIEISNLIFHLFLLFFKNTFELSTKKLD